MRLFLVRHGETEGNSAERYWGQTDVGLSVLGLRQAERLRERLRDEEIHRVYASDLKRAGKTAEIIAADHQLEVVSSAELREINFGKVEGLNFAEISEQFPEFAARWRRQTDADIKFPGGESFRSLSARVASFAERLKECPAGEAVLVVAHAGVLRTLICQLLGMESGGIYRLRVDLASLSIMETYPQGAILCRLNDVSHLD